MTADERINALLAQGGQTIEDLSRKHAAKSVAGQMERWIERNEYGAAFRLRDATDEILHFADVIDRMEAALINLAVDRDAWKRRCKAAERELGILRPCYCCKHYNKELAESGRECGPVCSKNCVIHRIPREARLRSRFREQMAGCL